MTMKDPLDTELGIQCSYIHTTSNTAIQDPPDIGIGLYVSKQEPGMHIVIIIPRTSNRILGSSGHTYMYEIVLIRILRTHRQPWTRLYFPATHETVCSCTYIVCCSYFLFAVEWCFIFIEIYLYNK